MSINYTFKIDSVKKKISQDQFTDIVVSAMFTVTAFSDPVTEVVGVDDSDNDIIETIVPSFAYTCNGTQLFDTTELNELSFIDFKDITTETIIDWIVSSESVSSIEEFSYVKSSIDHVKNKINEYSVEVVTTVPGENVVGSITD